MSSPRLQDYSRLIEYPVHKRLLSLLDGYHRGEGAGNSLEFLDMTEYTVGDDSSDIDWKATARLSQPVIKRFESTAVLSVVLAVDTGAGMAAHSSGAVVHSPSHLSRGTALRPGSGLPPTKQEIARELIRALTWLVTTHGDLIGLAAGNAKEVTMMPARAGVGHAETLVRVASTASTDGAPSNLKAILRQVDVGRRRSLIFVITDESQVTPETAVALRRLTLRHDVGLFIMEDYDPTSPRAREMVDVAAGPLPDFTEGHEVIMTQWRKARDIRTRQVHEMLKTLNVRYARLGDYSDILPALLAVVGGSGRATGTA